MASSSNPSSSQMTKPDAEPSGAEAAHYQRVLTEMVDIHREMEARFDGYHRQMTQRGEASNWDERSAEEAERADVIEWALEIIAKTEGRS